MRASSFLVRDHRQHATVNGDVITIQSFVGRLKAGGYTIPLTEWQKAASSRPTGFGHEDYSANPDYNKLLLITRYTHEYDEEPGGAGQAARIRDAQIAAIELALTKLGEC